MDGRSELDAENPASDIAFVNGKEEEASLARAASTLKEIAASAEMSPSEFLTTVRGQKLIKLLVIASSLPGSDRERLLERAEELQSNAEEPEVP